MARIRCVIDAGRTAIWIWANGKLIGIISRTALFGGSNILFMSGNGRENKKCRTMIYHFSVIQSAGPATRHKDDNGVDCSVKQTCEGCGKKITGQLYFGYCRDCAKPKSCQDILRDLVPEMPLPDFANKREYAAILLFFAAEDEDVWQHLSQMIATINAKRQNPPNNS